MAYEVEVKYRLEIAPDQPNRQDVITMLDAIGAVARGGVRQVDLYFNHPSRDFAQTDEALRLRWDGKNSCITYKGPKIDAETKTRREIELPIGNSEGKGASDLEQASQMLTLLGFREVAAVRKNREFFDLKWDNLDVEIVIDGIDALGDFVEIEVTADDDSLEKSRTAIRQIAERLGLKRSERRSYLELLLAEKPS